MRLELAGVFCVVVCALAAACGSTEASDDEDEELACVPGASQSCAGPGDCDGYQVCNEEGSAFEPCICDDGGSGGAGGSGGSAGTSGSGGTSGSADSGGTNGSGGSSTTDSGGSNSGGSGGSDPGTTVGPTASAGPVTVTSTDGSGGTAGGAGGVSGAGGSSTTGGGSGGTGGNCSVEPTVMLLIDRSTSMWDNMFWEPAREAVLGAIEELEGEVRFGFATFTGTGNTCPVDLAGDIGLDSYDDIAEFYNSIEHPGMSTEGPTAAALYTVSAALQSLSNDSRKTILLVTDGPGDFCDAGDTRCRADVTVRVLQDAAAAGIPTLVAALPDPGSEPEWMVAMANAGQGQPVSAPQDTEFCDDIPSATAAVLEGIDPSTWPSATYGDTMGPIAPIDLSDTGDVEGMTALLVDAISEWASCE